MILGLSELSNFILNETWRLVDHYTGENTVTFALQAAVSFGSRQRTEASWLGPEQQHINVFLFFGFQLDFALSLGKYKPKGKKPHMQHPFFTCQAEKVV